LRWPLKIFGIGPELKKLRSVAKSNIEFLGKISEEEKAKLLSRARAFIHPQVEDLGITPIESMSAGRPVIAYSVGGATETIVPGTTGVFFPEQNWNSLYNTVTNFDFTKWDSKAIQDHVRQFDSEVFKIKFQNFVTEKYQEVR
jgi:glycosyltransferase involved in cell wall biosynthesis